MRKYLLILPAAAGLAFAARAQDPDLPREWVDADTGHRIVQLSDEPETKSLYFTQYAYTDGGKKLMMTTSHGLQLVDLETRKIETIANGKIDRAVQAGRKTGDVYYVQGGFICSYAPATKTTKQLAKLPENARIWTINADETLAGGCIEPPEPDDIKPRYPPPPPGGYKPGDPRPGKDSYPDKPAYMARRLAAHLPTTIITVNLQTGKVNELYHANEWMNHYQFSPTDPMLLMFAHEGAWHQVNRIWFLRVDGHSQPKLVHQRTMTMEIVGHEFWGNDGKWIWYDMQAPRGEVYWVGGYNVETGQTVQYHIERDQASVHFNVSPDGTLFAGDGNKRSVNNKWIYLFRPHLTVDDKTLAGPSGLIKTGTFSYERLVNMQKHDYSLEPNVTFSPDMKWLIFRSNLRGKIQVYAVEVAKAP